MEKQKKDITINEEDAFNFIVKILREGFERITYPNYGYDLYLHNVILEYLIKVQGIEYNRISSEQKQFVSTFFYDAAWTLCRRGILRPGISIWGEQDTPEGSAGGGYSLTPFGKEWIKKASHVDYIPIEPGRFAKIISKLSPKFGPGFSERAQEAMRCYNIQTYLACCVMCGAASESIILAIAIIKKGNENEILRIYKSATGRNRIANFIIGQKNNYIKGKFLGYTDLLKYWRDIAGHGQKSDISDDEAYIALNLLLGFAYFANDNWDDLIT